MGARNDELLARYQRSVMGVFGLPPLVLSHGSGCHVWDVDGNRYLDLVGGIAVNALGHGHPALVSAISKQAGEAIHVSNLFTSEAQIALAERLIELAGAPEGSAVFFANSGAEAIEAAIKLSRRTGRVRHRRGRGRLPRPHHRRARADPQAGLPRALRAAHPRRQPRARTATRTPCALPSRPRPPPSSSSPSRARRASSSPGPAYLQLARELTRAARRAARPRRDPDRHRPHRHVVRVPAGRDRARRHHPRQGARRGSADRRARRLRARRSPGCSRPASTARRSAATRSRPLPALAVLETIEEQGLLAHAASAGQHLVDSVAGAWPSARHRRCAAPVCCGPSCSPQPVAAQVAAAGAATRASSSTPLRRNAIRLAPPLVISTDELDTFVHALPALLDASQRPRGPAA